jgi:hypothetical protein
MQTFTFLIGEKKCRYINVIFKGKIRHSSDNVTHFLHVSLQTKEESKSIGILFRQILSQNETSISMYRK